MGRPEMDVRSCSDAMGIAVKDDEHAAAETMRELR